MEKEYNIECDIKFTVDMDIKASSEAEAERKALEIFKDYYNLDKTGAYHLKDNVKIDVYPSVYED